MRRVNVSNFQDGMVKYIYLNGFILNGSGDCSLNITSDIDTALKMTTRGKIYKVVLEEINLEKAEVEVVSKKSEWAIKAEDLEKLK